MKVIKADSKNFENEVLRSDVPVIVDFNADWCGPCRMLGPVLEQVAAENDGFKVAAVNVDENEDIAFEYGISSIPCLIVFKDGQEVKRSVGLIGKEQVLSLVGGV
ncbi:MAG: thioredoxin [Ruminococcus sp.]|nr:thioredoxin [Ruminococcus sp.]MCR5141282.1 thioredoxin [Ruminococcus sp.]